MKLEEMDIKFWYVRDEKNIPVVTICEIRNKKDRIISYGLAICSKSDNPCKRIGREISFKRAIYCLTEGPVLGRHIHYIHLNNSIKDKLYSNYREYLWCNLSF